MSGEKLECSGEKFNLVARARDPLWEESWGYGNLGGNYFIPRAEVDPRIVINHAP